MENNVNSKVSPRSSTWSSGTTMVSEVEVYIKLEVGVGGIDDGIRLSSVEVGVEVVVGIKVPRVRVEGIDVGVGVKVEVGVEGVEVRSMSRSALRVSMSA